MGQVLSRPQVRCEKKLKVAYPNSWEVIISQKPAKGQF